MFPQILCNCSPWAGSASKTVAHTGTRASRACTVTARLSWVFLSSSVAFPSSVSRIASCFSTLALASLNSSAAASPRCSASVGGGRPSKAGRKASNFFAKSRMASAVSVSPSLVAWMNSWEAQVCTLLKRPTSSRETPPTSLARGHHGLRESRASKVPPTLLLLSSCCAEASSCLHSFEVYALISCSICGTMGGSQAASISCTSFPAMPSTRAATSCTPLPASKSGNHPPFSLRMIDERTMTRFSSMSVTVLLLGAAACALSTMLRTSLESGTTDLGSFTFSMACLSSVRCSFALVSSSALIFSWALFM
mmetsp:Transcript_35351/g.111140  ORF Transcript_35351/g.111140 Transcript_35351/m.111140 type:complete len:309 (+) Transcript_35351:1908-2834(+)